MKKSQIRTVFNKLDLEVRSTKHNYGWLKFEGKKILRVHFSHGKGEIPVKVVEKIRSQLKLSKNDFKELIKCPPFIGCLDTNSENKRAY